MSVPEEWDRVTQFLNVDLEFRSQYDLDELLNSIEPFVFVLHKDKNFVSLELGNESNSLEETAVKIVELIQSLPPSARAVWDQCHVRSFDIGIEGGNKPHAACFTLSNSTVSLLANIGVNVAITVYAAKELKP